MYEISQGQSQRGAHQPDAEGKQLTPRLLRSPLSRSKHEGMLQLRILRMVHFDIFWVKPWKTHLTDG